MEVADTFLILTLRLIHTKPVDDKCNPAHTAYISKGNAMSKSIKQVRVPVSPDYRIAPSSRAESVIGLMIILAVGLALVLGAEGRIFLGVLVFVGALVANAAVTITRNAR